MTAKKTTKKRATKLKPKKTESLGVGDIVEEVLEKTGVAKVAKFILGEDCGCDKRKEKLNNIFRNDKKPDCLQEDEYQFLDTYFKKNTTNLKPSEQERMREIYGRIFRRRKPSTSCSSCLKTVYTSLRRVYETYEAE